MDSDGNVNETVRKIFIEYLASNRLRKTPERFAILDAVYSIDGHFDIDTLYNRLISQDNFHVSRATVYNTLELLIDAKLVIPHHFANLSQYERNYNRSTHHHMICTQCGKVREFQDSKLQKDIESARLTRFTLNHYSLYMYGLCSSCKRINSRKSVANNRKKTK